MGTTAYDQRAVYAFGIERVDPGHEVPTSLLELVGRLYALCEQAEAHAAAQRVTVLDVEAAPLSLAAIDLVQRQEGFSLEVQQEAECLADFLYALVQRLITRRQTTAVTSVTCQLASAQGLKIGA